MGRAKVAEFLALMRSRHGGGAFELDEFIAAMTETEPAVAVYFEHFMRESTLPGFLASDLRVARLGDDENGQTRYQLSVHVRNDEPVPGVAGISSGSSYGNVFEWRDASRFPGNTSLELGVVTQTPPREVRLETYLAQNRRTMRLAIPPIDAETTVPDEPFNGSRPSDWLPPDLGIVVDDLDPGFAAAPPPQRGIRPRFDDEAAHAESAVPEYEGDASLRLWRRQESPHNESWGKYRRTLTRIPAGAGEGRASFRTVLPKAARWRLSYHLPGSTASQGNRTTLPTNWIPRDTLGSLDIAIEAGERRVPVTFDARTAIAGWNDIGTFDLPAGPVTVVVSDATTGDVVVADAIRWEPVTTDARVPTSENSAAGS